MDEVCYFATMAALGQLARAMDSPALVWFYGIGSQQVGSLPCSLGNPSGVQRAAWESAESKHKISQDAARWSRINARLQQLPIATRRVLEVHFSLSLPSQATRNLSAFGRWIPLLWVSDEDLEHCRSLSLRASLGGPKSFAARDEIAKIINGLRAKLTLAIRAFGNEVA